MSPLPPPKFGNLQNLKVINASSVVAGPFMCELFAEQGADVIQLESTVVADMYRLWPQSWSMERRNQRSMTLNIPDPAGRPGGALPTPRRRRRARRVLSRRHLGRPGA